MNLQEILKQLNELEKKDVRDLEVDENIELEKGCICGSCRELNGLSISTKSITDLDFPFTKIIRVLITRLNEAEEVIRHHAKEAEEVIKYYAAERYAVLDLDNDECGKKARAYLEKWNDF